MLNLLCCWPSLSPLPTQEPQQPSKHLPFSHLSLKTLDFPLSSQILRMVLGPFQQISFANISVVLVSKIQNKNKFNTLVNCPPWIHSRNGGGNYSYWGSLGVGVGAVLWSPQGECSSVRRGLLPERIPWERHLLTYQETLLSQHRESKDSLSWWEILPPSFKSGFTQGTQVSSWQPHCPSNEELKSVPLAAHLEFTASPTPVFWTQNQIYGLEHRVS